MTVMFQMYCNVFLLQIVDREQRVAFIGISNWALDPAKMNRGVMVARGDPDQEELETSARYNSFGPFD